MLIDVYEQAGRVRLLGAADRRYVGRRVRIRFIGTGRTVARPPARYDASIGKQRSMKLKLERRMLAT